MIGLNRPIPPRHKSPDELRVERAEKVKANALSQSVSTLKQWAMNRQNLALQKMGEATGDEFMVQAANFSAFYEAWKAINVFELDFGTDHDF